MKKIKTLSSLALLLMAASCSKSNNDVQPVSPANKQLKEVMYAMNGQVEKSKLTYDQQNRLATYTDDDHRYEFLYETATSLKVTRKKQSDGSTDQSIACTLNANGAITKLVYISMPANTIAYTYDLTYDANQIITKWKGTSGGGSTSEETFEIVNGNAVSSKLYHDGTLYNNRVYVYDQAKINKGPFPHWYIWPSETLFGKPAKNLLKEFKNTDKNGVLTWHTKSTYQLDNSGYPAKLITDYIIQNTQEVATYTFQ